MRGSFQPYIEVQDRLVQKEKRSKYQGTAKIKISCLQFEAQSREQFLRPKNIQRLKRIFATEGCHRFVPEHYIAALISQPDLEAAIQRSGTSQAALLRTVEEPPKLEILEFRPLKFLHGRHRLQAASEYLSPDDDWWIVDLYSDDMSPIFKNLLREEYSNSANFCDGEIFRHIRLYHKQKDVSSENKWWARLTKDKSKDLKRVLDVEGLCQAFDDLLHVPGLWPAFHIGSMRRYLVLKCHEELANYLRCVRNVWLDISGGDLTIMQMIDEATVKCLELRAPKASKEDADFIVNSMNTGKLFSFISDISLKEKILQNILRIERIIPTLYTFCEDTKYLEPCAIGVKKLLEPKLSDTVKMTLRKSFRGFNMGQGIFLRQDGERRYVQVKGNKEEEFEFSYRQLWMYAMRHFPDLVNVAPRKEPNKEKPIVKEPDPILWQQFADLALRLGFQSDKMKELGSAEALDRAIRNYLLRITEYISEEESLEAQVTQVKNRLEREDQSNSIPALTNDTSDTTLQRRCGRPFEDSQAEAKENLYIRYVYAEETNAKYITSFFVQRATFIAFFGNGIRHTVFHDDRVSDPDSEMMDENMSLDDQEQNHSRTITANDTTQDFNVAGVSQWALNPENLMMPTSFGGDLGSGHVPGQDSFNGLLQLASEDLETSASQAIVLLNDPTDFDQHMTTEDTSVDDASFISTSNVQTVVLWSDHAHHEQHTTIESMDVDDSTSDLSEKESVGSINGPLRLTSGNLDSSTSRAVVLWSDPTHHEQHAAIENTNLDTSFTSISDVSHNENVDSVNESLQLTRGNLENSTSQAIVLWSDPTPHATTTNTKVDDSSFISASNVDSVNERNRSRKRPSKHQRRMKKTRYCKQKQHPEIITPNKKDLKEAASIDQAESCSSKRNQNHEDHSGRHDDDSALHGRTDRVPDDGDPKTKANEPLHTDNPSKRREGLKGRDSSVYKQTDRVPGDGESTSIKWRKIKSSDDKTDHFYTKSKTKVDASFLTGSSSKRCEDFKDHGSSVQTRTDRVPGDGGPTSIKWRKIKSPATYDFEEEL